MKIELKNVKHAGFASQETDCFTATIYLDGVRSGVVSNEGNGGPDRFEPRGLETRIDAYAATLPPCDVSYLYKDGRLHTIPQSAETLIAQLLNEYLTNRQLKRICAKTVLFRKPGTTYAANEYSTLKCKYSPAAKAQLVAKYGAGVVVLNETLV